MSAFAVKLDENLGRTHVRFLQGAAIAPEAQLRVKAASSLL
jgi:hypothetical protein